MFSAVFPTVGLVKRTTGKHLLPFLFLFLHKLAVSKQICQHLTARVILRNTTQREVSKSKKR